ncbi:hypothetical protein ACFQV4_06755 [Streptomyces thermocarboxydus]
MVTALIGATGDVMMPAYYMMAAAVIGGFAVWRMAESACRPLPGSPASLEPGHTRKRSRRSDSPGPRPVSSTADPAGQVRLADGRHPA